MTVKQQGPRRKRGPAAHSCDPVSVYFAGDLWNHKDLIGNALLAQYIEKRSQGAYRCVVPQDLEQATRRAVNIRNQDLKQVMSCDMALFNFDGTELDSGTVVEFMYAKLLDVPCVILRSDFRSAGDGDKDGDPWNLMVSNWPRARVVRVNAMEEYQRCMHAAGDLPTAMEQLYTELGDLVIENLNAARQEAPVGTHAHARLVTMYEWAARFPGGGLRQLMTHHKLDELVTHKQEQGLL